MRALIHCTLALAALTLLGCPRDQDAPAAGTTSADSTAGDESGTTDGACVGPAGCYDCAPSNGEQVLNRCTDATCEPFANTVERLPLLGADGALPPIP